MAEDILYQESPSMFRNSPVRFILYLVLCLVGIGLILFLFWWLDCKSTVLTVTDKTVTLRKGIFSKSTNEVRIDDIRNVQIDQSVMQRLLGTGTVGIASAGFEGIEIKVSGLPDPEEIKDIINRYRE